MIVRAGLAAPPAAAGRDRERRQPDGDDRSDRGAGAGRFTALRRFRLDVSEDGTTFRPYYTSPANPFPGFNPRPVAPEMILREFTFPAVQAVAVRLVVLDDQCTGNAAFQGDQDADPTSGSDCREGSPGGGPVPVFGDLPQVLAPRDNEVHAAELPVFTR